MNRFWAKLVLTGTVFSASLICNSQQPAASTISSPSTAETPIRVGTVLQVGMTNDVDVKKVHPGDIFRTRLWDDVRNGDKIVLPRKTIVVGHVVEAHPQNKEVPESKLTIAFDKAVLKDGSEVPLHGVVERVEFSAIALASAADAKSHTSGPNGMRGSTTNIAMPTQGVDDGTPIPTSDPTGIQDKNIVAQADASGTVTVLTSSNKTDVKLKQYATLDVRITHSGN